MQCRVTKHGSKPSLTVRLLHTCERCREHKTRCDAVHGMPCTACVKRNRRCRPVLVSRPMGREKSSESIMRVRIMVDEIKRVVDKRMEETSVLMRRYTESSSAESSTAPESGTASATLTAPASSTCSATGASTASDYEIEEWFDSLPELRSENSSGNSPGSSFLSSNPLEYPPDASFHFSQYKHQFNPIMPIFNDTFFDPKKVFKQDELVFWCIMGISRAYGDEQNQESHGNGHGNFPGHDHDHVSSLLISHCFHQTPTVSVLCALLLLSTWPLEESMCIKYVGFMRTLASQLRVQLKSHPHPSVDIPSLLQYMLITEHTWMLRVGTASYTPIYSVPEYMGVLLRLSYIQMKMSEVMEYGGVIEMYMFERILEEIEEEQQSNDDNPMGLSSLLLSCYLHLYLHTLSIPMALPEYKTYIAKLVKCCFSISQQCTENIGRMPIFHQHTLELAALALAVVYKTPYLNTVSDYEIVRHVFVKIFKVVTNRGIRVLIEKFDLVGGSHNTCLQRRQVWGMEKEMKRMVYLHYRARHYRAERDSGATSLTSPIEQSEIVEQHQTTSPTSSIEQSEIGEHNRPALLSTTLSSGAR